MTAGAATLLQKRWAGFGTGLGRLLGDGREIGGGSKEVRVGLGWDAGCRVKCSLEAGKGRAMCRAVKEEVQEVVETGNGPAGAPDSFSDGDPGNEFIGFGAMQENGSMYRERFVVRFSEVGDRGTTSLEMMSSLLQEAACNHVLTIGYGAFPGMNERVITVTTRMHIEVDRYPAWRELLEIDTWFCTEGRNAVRRDWTVRKVGSGEIIAVATSTWVLMHMDTKTIHRVTDKIRADFAPWARDPPQWALSEARRQASSERILRLNEDAEFHEAGLQPLSKDIDMNQHVNNIKYISWALESIPQEFKEAHEVSKITLEYRREVGKGDTLDSFASKEPLKSTNGASTSEVKFIHMMRNQDRDEINKGRTVWRPLGRAET